MSVNHTHLVAVYPGDGIGQDTITEAVKCLKSVECALRGDMVLNLEQIPWGLEYWKKTGKVTPTDFLKQLSKYEAILFGALGDPRVLPDHVTLSPLIQMRQQFDQYVCLRPAKLLPGIASPLGDTSHGIDIAIVRENSEGEYAKNGGHFKMGTPDEIALETSVHTRKGVERIITYAFQLSLTRRKHVTLATKSNAIKFGMVMWDNIFDEIAVVIVQRFSLVYCTHRNTQTSGLTNATLMLCL